MAAAFVHLHDYHAFESERENVDMVILGPRYFADRRARANRKQVRRHRRIGVGVALRDYNDLFVFGGNGCLYRGQRGRPAHGKRHQQARKQHGILQRQQRQCANFSNVRHNGLFFHSSISMMLQHGPRILLET